MTSTPRTGPLPVMGDWRPIQRAPQQLPPEPRPIAPEPQQAPVPPGWGTRAGDWLRDTGLGATGFVLVLIVACAGWAASFIGLHDFGEKHMGLNGDTAWLVPITFDGAALGLSLVVFRASINGRGANTWRVLIIVFTGLSSWINYQHITDETGRLIASLMPPSAVVLFEGLMSEARAAASRKLGRERPRLHPLRWCIDRRGTWAMYRAYILGIEVPEHLKASADRSGDDRQEALTERGVERPAERGEPAVSVERERAPQPPVSAPLGRALNPAPAERAHADGMSAPASPVSAPPERAQPKPERGAQRKPQQRKSATRASKASATVSDRERRIECARGLYSKLRRRPEWTEIRDALVSAKLADADISRPTVQRIRDAVEEREPALAALGTDNVRPLPKTGS